MFGHHERNKQQPNNFSLSASLKKRENARASRMTKQKENFGEKRKKEVLVHYDGSHHSFSSSPKKGSFFFFFSGSPVASNQDGQSSFFSEDRSLLIINNVLANIHHLDVGLRIQQQKNGVLQRTNSSDLPKRQATRR